jgi:hypothetical protein
MSQALSPSQMLNIPALDSPQNLSLFIVSAQQSTGNPFILLAKWMGGQCWLCLQWLVCQEHH